MSLLVWLPLTQDLRNQGLSNITVTNNGAIIDNNGKIGKCYSFGTGTSNLILPNEPIKACTTECSLSMWLNITTWNTSYATYFQAGLGGAPWAHYIFGVLRNGTGSNLCFTISNGSTSSQASYTTPALTLNTWYHLAFVYKTGHCLIYINGELYQDYTTTIVPNFDAITKTTIGACNTTSSYQTNCKLNDVRIYDHALSAKEVELLARGLVCHYPLNGNGRGGDNIMPISYVMNLGTSSAANGVWRLAGTNNMNRSRVQTDDGFYAFENSGIQTANDGSCYGIDSFVFEANTTYTMSMIARITEGTEGYAGFSPSNVTVIGGTHTKYERYYYVTPLTTTWRRIYIIFTTGDSTTRNIYIGVTTGSTSVTTQMALVKIEKGDKSTPWIPKSTDVEYTKMGYGSTTEYNVSGNGNNGMKNNITYDSNTTRYSACSKFDGSSTRIAFSDIYVGNEWSYGLWVKAPQSTTRSWENVVMLNETGSDSDTQLAFWLNLKSNVCQSSANKQYNSGIAYPNDGNWHHFFATFDGSDLKTYIDGLLVNTKAITNTWFQRTHLTIGAIRTGDNTYNFYSLCNLSDFRLYATALSDIQVANLYNTVASVANNDTLLGYEFVEV